MISFRALPKNCSGAAAAEMALVIPMLFALIFTTFEGANYLWNEHKVVKGVRDGARYAGRLPFSIYDCAANTISNTNGEVDHIKNLTRTGYTNGDNPNIYGTDNPVIKDWDNGEVSVTVNCLAPDAANPNDPASHGIYTSQTAGAPRVTVSASVPYPSLFSLLGFDTTGLHIRASAQSAVMGI